MKKARRPRPNGDVQPEFGPDEARLVADRLAPDHPTSIRTMKSLIPNLRTMAALAAVLAIPHLASAARTFQSVIVTPASTNITAGVATNVTANVAVRNGSSGSGRFIGTAQITASVSPSATGVSATITSTNLVYPNADTTFSVRFSLQDMTAWDEHVLDVVKAGGTVEE